ncbi:DUF1127 domain-containing protein [Halomonas heilongjiangensis]|uniref:YjiS-like domain-containing protein n=1 Tax=Halomonas heilongjiangensis TaxID=1387883 RepID=A0A2N7TN53_9GAMM|nr:DUF1127 domain-containing protein [Halomonas heilongjiangensis]PMR69619.1 hypothetical protein C1H66_09990 [Halomonas heilongjiangensis]PXX86954.1 hypothetical protein CR158_21705 [Halomonas heilongjiangensis]
MRAPACNDSSSCAASDSAEGVWPFTSLLWRWIRRMNHQMQLRHERRQLGELSDSLLRDIGLTRREAMREARRPFWDDIGWRR